MGFDVLKNMIYKFKIVRRNRFKHFINILLSKFDLVILKDASIQSNDRAFVSIFVSSADKLVEVFISFENPELLCSAFNQLLSVFFIVLLLSKIVDVEIKNAWMRIIE